MKDNFQWEKAMLTMRIILYTILTILTFLIVSGKVFAAQLVVVNHTGTDARIDHLRNRCDGDLVKSPVLLKNNESVTFQVKEVIQTFEVCSSGLCSQSAVGMKDSPKYLLEIILDKQGAVDTKVTPDHWTGSNKECGK